MTTELRISFDAYTLSQAKVDLMIYQDKLRNALPQYLLVFSIAPDVPMSVGFPCAINTIFGADLSVTEALNAAKEIWPLVKNTYVGMQINHVDAKE